MHSNIYLNKFESICSNLYTRKFLPLFPSIYNMKFFFTRILRSSCPEVFCKKGVLENFAKVIEKHLRQSLFFNEVAGLPVCNFIKKETLTLVFSCEFCQISKNTFFIEHLRWMPLDIPQTFNWKINLLLFDIFMMYIIKSYNHQFNIQKEQSCLILSITSSSVIPACCNKGTKSSQAMLRAQTPFTQKNKTNQISFYNSSVKFAKMFQRLQNKAQFFFFCT